MLHVEEPPVRLENDRPTQAQAVSTWSGHAREQAVQGMFTSIAGVYDLNNTLLSFGLHHRWKHVAASYVPPVTGGRAIDIGAGTADLALLIEPRMGTNGQVIASDLTTPCWSKGSRRLRSGV